MKAQSFAFEKDLTDAREAVGKSLEEIEKVASSLNIKLKTMMIIMK